MKSEYKNGMEHISLTDDAKETILNNLQFKYDSLQNKSQGVVDNMYDNMNDNDNSTVISMDTQKSKGKNIFKYVAIAASVLAAVGLGYVGITHLKPSNNTATVVSTSPSGTASGNSSKSDDYYAGPDDNEASPTETPISNPDYVANLTYYSGDKKITYPVVQGDDNIKYLYEDINGKKLASGTLFIDSRCNLDNTNLIMIYGHNMKESTKYDIMFGKLKLYKDKTYWQNHKEITFGTDTYEIFAAYYRDRGKSFDLEDEKDVSLNSKEDYEAYVNSIISKSEYDTGITPVYGEKLMLLATTTVSDTGIMRFSVLARKVEG